VIPGQQIKLFDPSSMQGGGGAQFEVQLRGNLALAELDALADKFIAELRLRDGFVDLDKSLKLGLPEIRVVPERKDHDTPAEIEQLYVRGSDGQLAELRNLVSVETGAAPSAITRWPRSLRASSTRSRSCSRCRSRWWARGSDSSPRATRSTCSA
jgi:multidrug efflux pump subunit AcrB